MAVNGAPIKPAPMPWESLVSAIGFPNEDQKFWWQCLAPVLGKFMQKSDYNVDQQYSYLSWFHNFILPSLGPRPEPGKERTWRCQLTHNGVPFQPSWNFQAGKTTVRFTIEPYGYAAGTKEDVFNQRAGFELMKRLKLAMPDMQDDWFYHCARELYVPKDLINMMLLVGGPPKGPKPPTVFIAFDLNDKIETKAYFFPHIRAKVMGITQGELIINTVRGFNGNGVNMNPSLDAFEEYLNSGGPVNHKNVEMLAIDCIDPTQARAKIYVNSFNNSFNKIKDIYTMGGRLNDKAINDSLVVLKDLWRILFDMPETDFEDIEIPNIMHPRSCFVTGFEFKSGDPLPTTKVYFPMWHYLKSDKQMSDALSTFFAKQGWDKLAQSYGSDIQQIFMEPELDTTPGTHLYLSFAWKNKSGAYCTQYYSPTIPHLTQRHTPCPEGEGNPMILMGPPMANGPMPIGFRVLSTIWPVLKMIVPGQVNPLPELVY